MSPQLLAGRVLTPAGMIGPAAVTIEGGLITGVAPVADAPDVIVAPGFVDLQVNGMDDVDVATAEDQGWDRLDALLLASGVTTWFPTLPTLAPERYPDALAGIAAAAARLGRRPAIGGAHLEGPFLARAGAHPPEHLRAFDADWLASLPPIVRLVTVAPELVGAPAVIAALVERDITVSVGHTDASAAEVRCAALAGATLATHLFNVMPPISARAPGAAGAVLVDDRITACVIADLAHVHPELLALAFRAKPGRIALVTDAVAWRGVPSTAYDGVVPRRPDGTIAGSTLTLDRAVANVVRAAGVDVAEALRAASTVPAAALGLHDRGTIAVGRRADLVVLGPALDVRQTWIAGQLAHGAPTA
ncbi:MAG: amidohydrolase family protein [Acidimicrobiales bacterium]